MGKLYARTVATEAHKKYEINIEAYDSANEVAKDCETRERKEGGWHEPGYGSWEGVKSHEEAMELLRSGYEPVVKKMKEKLKITASGTGKRTSFRNDIQGFAPVVPLAMKGVPNCMVNTNMKPIKNKVIDVYYDMSVSCSTSSEQIIENGTNILGALLELEAQGYKFNLYAVQTYAEYRDCDMLIVKIKSSNQPFDLKRMSFPLTHTAFFRIVGFDWYGKCPTTKYRPAYGHTLGYEFSKKEMNTLVRQMFGNNAVWFSGRNLVDENQDYIKEVLVNAGQNKSEDR